MCLWLSLSLKEVFNYCQIIYLSEQNSNNKKLQNLELLACILSVQGLKFNCSTLLRPI